MSSGTDLGDLVARFAAMATRPALPVEGVTYLVGQLANDVARAARVAAKVSPTQHGCSVSFKGANAAAAYAMMRRRLNTSSGALIAAATNTILEELK